MFKPIWLPNCMLKYIYVLKSIWAVKYLWARINMGLHIYIYIYVCAFSIYIYIYVNKSRCTTKITKKYKIRVHSFLSIHITSSAAASSLLPHTGQGQAVAMGSHDNDNATIHPMGA